MNFIWSIWDILKCFSLGLGLLSLAIVYYYCVLKDKSKEKVVKDINLPRKCLCCGNVTSEMESPTICKSCYEIYLDWMAKGLMSLCKERLTCPRCETLFVNEVCLTSNPPQYEFECRKCDFKLRYYDRKDPFAKVMQEELNEVGGFK